MNEVDPLIFHCICFVCDTNMYFSNRESLNKRVFDFAAHMDAESDSNEEINELRVGFATIKLSKETKSSIQAPWSKAIIIKVFGRTVGFTFLHAKIMGLWKPTGRLDMVDLGKDFFLVRYSV